MVENVAARVANENARWRQDASHNVVRTHLVITQIKAHYINAFDHSCSVNQSKILQLMQAPRLRDATKNSIGTPCNEAQPLLNTGLPLLFQSTETAPAA